MDQEDRLKKIDEALLKHKPQAPVATNRKSKSIWSVAITILSHMISGVALGYAIDSLLDSKPKAIAVCSLLSVVACFFDIIRAK
jgi:F0F1-type ATP synthase assembly protein I